MAQTIFHVDLDAFFASVEEQINPAYQNHPLIVAGHSMRTVVAAANYAARAFGIKAGEPVSIALQKCPTANVVAPHYQKYTQLSRRFVRLLQTRVSHLTQAVSIDECYVDVSSQINNGEQAIKLAEELKQMVKKELGLSVSVGIGPNHLLAKMASDMQKPYGTTLLTNNDVQSKLWPLNVNKIPGVGKVTHQTLQNLGIKTIGDLAHYSDLNQLRKILGKHADYLSQAAWGKGEVVIGSFGYSDEPKSISAAITLISDLTDYKAIQDVIHKLCQELAQRLRDTRVYGTGVAISLKDQAFKTRTKSQLIKSGIYLFNQLFDAACTIFANCWQNQPIRMVGVKVYGLINIDENKLIKKQLMDALQKEPKHPIKTTNELINEINELFGFLIIKPASEI